MRAVLGSLCIIPLILALHLGPCSFETPMCAQRQAAARCTSVYPELQLATLKANLWGGPDVSQVTRAPVECNAHAAYPMLPQYVSRPRS